MNLFTILGDLFYGLSGESDRKVPNQNENMRQTEQDDDYDYDEKWRYGVPESAWNEMDTESRHDIQLNHGYFDDDEEFHEFP